MGKEISKEQLDYTIDLLITMTVEELSEDLHANPENILPDFLCSNTGKALYDSDTKLWWNGPSYLADMYRKEKNL